MAERNMYVRPTKDTYINEAQITENYGIDNILRVGTLSNELFRGIMQFLVPEFPEGATVNLTTLRLVVTYTPGNLYMQIYKLDTNREQWKEGSGSSLGSPTFESTNWGDWLPSTPWDTPGGDFSGLFVNWDVPSAATVAKTIIIDGLAIIPGEEETLVFVPVWEGTIPGNDNVQIKARTTPLDSQKPYIQYLLEDPNWFIDCFVTDISSRYVDITWVAKTLDQCPDFLNYIVEWSPDGIGSWTTLVTETDITIGVYQQEVVPPGDVDLYDHNLDTWPNGRQRFYRVTLTVRPDFIGNTSLDQEVTSNVVNHTSLPAPRSMSYADINGNKVDQLGLNAFWELSNYAYWDPIHGRTLQFNLGWFEEGIETDLSRIEELQYEVQIAGVGGWSIAFPVTGVTPILSNEFNLIDLIVPFQTLVDAFPALSFIVTIKLIELNGHLRWITFTGTTKDELYGRLPVRPSIVLKGGGGIFNTNDIVPFDARLSNSINSWKKLFVGADGSFWNNVIGVPIFNIPADTITFNNDGINITTSLPDEFEFNENRNWMWKSYQDMSAGIMVRIIHSTRDSSFVTGYVLTLQTVGPNINWELDRDAINVASGTITIRAGTYFGLEFTREDIPGQTIITAYCNFSNGKDAIMDEIITQFTDLTPLPGGTIAYRTIGAGVFVIENPRVFGKPEDMNIIKNQGFQLVPDIGIPSTLSTIPYPINLIAKCDPLLTSSPILITPTFIDKKNAQATYVETQSITVNNATPVAVLFATSSGFTTTNIALNGSQSFDPEGSDLIYEFDFGDGTPILSTSDSIVTYVYGVAGTYTTRLRVTDETGLQSSWADKEITIIEFSDQIVELTFLSQAAIESAVPSRTPGLNITAIVNVAENYLQNTKASGRIFAITGHTAQCDNLKTHTQLVAETKSEVDKMDLYYKNGTIIEINIPFWGIIRGIITNYIGSPNPDNIEVAEWSFDFVEVTTLSLGA